MEPYKCPVCDGRGSREVANLYGTSSTVPPIESCRACNGGHLPIGVSTQCMGDWLVGG